MRFVNLFLFFVVPISSPLYRSYEVKNEKVVICGIGKDIAPYIPHMRERMEELGNAFSDYRIVIYENNSGDNSVELLTAWASENWRVTLITEILSQEDIAHIARVFRLDDRSPSREELIAHGRNRLLQYAEDSFSDEFNFLIMTDLDFNRGWDVSGVVSCFDFQFDWDCLAANAVRDGSYYERYAYRDLRFPLGPEIIGLRRWNELWALKQNIPPLFAPHKIYSAFGGIAVYRRKSLKNCWYSGIITKDIERFNQRMIDKAANAGNFSCRRYKSRLYKSSSSIYQANEGFNGPIVCEHIGLHASMIANGCGRIYVNPKMICYYD